jgi:hypothetical protein
MTSPKATGVPAEPTAAELVERWERWLTRAYSEVVVLRDYEASWDDLVDVVEANRAIPQPNHVMDFIRELYGIAVAVGIRRQSDADRQGRVANLRHVISDIGKHPEVITRDSFVAGYQEFMLDVGHETFDEFAGPGGAHVDAAIIAADLAKLDAATEKVKTFVDKHLAHSDDQAAASLTFQELRDSLEEVSELIRRYYLLVHGGSLLSTIPTKQYDWLRPLLVPWVPDNRMLRLLRAEDPPFGGSDVEVEVRQALDQNQTPTIEQTEALLAVIDQLRAELAQHS